jgi:hypothetical protein
MANLKKFTEYLIENGGATYGVYNGVLNPTVGYFASYETSGEKLPLGVFLERGEEIVRNFVLKHSNTLSKLGRYLGGWVYEEYVYLDVSRQFARLEDAQGFAEANDQLAIRDAANSKTLMIK